MTAGTSLSAPFVYLDASAAVKLITREAETPALQEWLAGWPRRLSSELLRVELSCFSDRNAVPRPVTDAVTGDLRLLPLTTQTITAALQRFSPPLRALDALHLAAALSVRQVLAALVTYDREQAAAAAAAGLAVASPT